MRKRGRALRRRYGHHESIPGGDRYTSEREAVAAARVLAEESGSPVYVYWHALWSTDLKGDVDYWLIAFGPEMGAPGMESIPKYPYTKVHPDGRAVVHTRSAYARHRRSR